MKILLPVALAATVLFAVLDFAQTKLGTFEALSQAREPLVLENGTITGSGAKTLQDAVLNAHYVLVGEDHGIEQIPAFCSALFDWLAPQGFKTLVVEAGPVATRNLRSFLNKTDPAAEVARFSSNY